MKVKALLLLTVFIANSLIGFGCALFMNTDSIDINSADSKPSVHDHNSHDHGSSAKVSTYPVLNHKIIPASKVSPQDSSCCQSSVNSFISLTKDTPQTGKVLIKAPAVLIQNLHPLFLLAATNEVVIVHWFALNEHHPPTPDIRIAIQSFLI